MLEPQPASGSRWAGVAIVVGAPGPRNAPIGIALALIGAVAFAAYLIAVRGTDVRHGTLAITSRTYTYAALALGAAAIATGDHLPPASDGRAWGGIFAMAFVSQLFGHTALNAGVRVLGATLVSMFILLEPVIPPSSPRGCSASGSDCKRRSARCSCWPRSRSRFAPKVKRPDAGLRIGSDVRAPPSRRPR